MEAAEVAEAAEAAGAGSHGAEGEDSRDAAQPPAAADAAAHAAAATTDAAAALPDGGEEAMVQRSRPAARQPSQPRRANKQSSPSTVATSPPLPPTPFADGRTLARHRSWHLGAVAHQAAHPRGAAAGAAAHNEAADAPRAAPLRGERTDGAEDGVSADPKRAGGGEASARTGAQGAARSRSERRSSVLFVRHEPRGVGARTLAAVAAGGGQSDSGEEGQGASLSPRAPPPRRSVSVASSGHASRPLAAAAAAAATGAPESRQCLACGGEMAPLPPLPGAAARHVTWACRTCGMRLSVRAPAADLRTRSAQLRVGSARTGSLRACALPSRASPEAERRGSRAWQDGAGGVPGDAEGAGAGTDGAAAVAARSDGSEGGGDSGGDSDTDGSSARRISMSDGMDFGNIASIETVPIADAAASGGAAAAATTTTAAPAPTAAVSITPAAAAAAVKLAVTPASAAVLAFSARTGTASPASTRRGSASSHIVPFSDYSSDHEDAEERDGRAAALSAADSIALPSSVETDLPRMRAVAPPLPPRPAYPAAALPSPALSSFRAASPTPPPLPLPAPAPASPGTPPRSLASQRTPQLARSPRSTSALLHSPRPGLLGRLRRHSESAPMSPGTPAPASEHVPTEDEMLACSPGGFEFVRSRRRGCVRAMSDHRACRSCCALMYRTAGAWCTTTFRALPMPPPPPPLPPLPPPAAPARCCLHRAPQAPAAIGVTAGRLVGPRLLAAEAGAVVAVVAAAAALA